jgi:hyperosmotically inducible periplasmic protein
MKIKLFSTVSLGIMLAFATACTQNQQNSADQAGEKTKDTASDAADKTKDTANDAADKTKEAAGDAMDKTKEAASKAGENISEAGLTGKVKSKLAADVRLSTLTAVNVDSEGSVVTLSGHVPNARDKRSAEKVAASVDGVTKVVNHLTVAP